MNETVFVNVVVAVLVAVSFGVLCQRHRFCHIFCICLVLHTNRTQRGCCGVLSYYRRTIIVASTSTARFAVVVKATTTVILQCSCVLQSASYCIVVAVFVFTTLVTAPDEGGKTTWR